MLMSPPDCLLLVFPPPGTEEDVQLLQGVTLAPVPGPLPFLPPRTLPTLPRLLHIFSLIYSLVSSPDRSSACLSAMVSAFLQWWLWIVPTLCSLDSSFVCAPRGGGSWSRACHFRRVSGSGGIFVAVLLSVSAPYVSLPESGSYILCSNLQAGTALAVTWSKRKVAEVNQWPGTLMSHLAIRSWALSHFCLFQLWAWSTCDGNPVSRTNCFLHLYEATYFIS